MANGASGSGRGETELSIGAASPAGSDVFPALLPNLTTLREPFQTKNFTERKLLRTFTMCVHEASNFRGCRGEEEEEKSV